MRRTWKKLNISLQKSEDKDPLADDLRQVFATDRPDDTPKKGWERWQWMCNKWWGKYRQFARLTNDPFYRPCFTYLKYHWRMRNMIYTTNLIEHLNKDFRSVLRNRNSMPDEESVITLMGHVSMNKSAYSRKVPKLNAEVRLFKESFPRKAPKKFLSCQPSQEDGQTH